MNRSKIFFLPLGINLVLIISACVGPQKKEKIYTASLSEQDLFQEVGVIMLNSADSCYILNDTLIRTAPVTQAISGSNSVRDESIPIDSLDVTKYVFQDEKILLLKEERLSHQQFSTYSEIHLLRNIEIHDDPDYGEFHCQKDTFDFSYRFSIPIEDCIYLNYRFDKRQAYNIDMELYDINCRCLARIDMNSSGVNWRQPGLLPGYIDTKDCFYLLDRTMDGNYSSIMRLYRLNYDRLDRIRIMQS